MALWVLAGFCCADVLVCLGWPTQHGQHTHTHTHPYSLVDFGSNFGTKVNERRAFLGFRLSMSTIQAEEKHLAVVVVSKKKVKKNIAKFVLSLSFVCCNNKRKVASAFEDRIVYYSWKEMGWR